MDLIITVLVAALIGVVCYYITTWPMDAPVKMAIRIFAAIVLILWLIARLGVAVPNVMP